MNSTSPPSERSAGRSESSTSSILSRAVITSPRPFMAEIYLSPATPVNRAGSGRAGRPVGDRLALHEQQQIVRPACLGVRAGHVEPAERLHADEGAGALPVQVQFADVEFLAGAI